MANIIAVIWDCDKTLVDGYMQDPIFEESESMRLISGEKLIQSRQRLQSMEYALTEIHII